MNVLLLPTEDLLKCVLCKNYLSHFPIYSSPENGNICGRCPLPLENPYIHNNAFETISQCLQFPCRYKTEGCVEEFLPKEIPQHEETCNYRPRPCPAAPTCDFKGVLHTLSEHCRNAHSNLIVENGKLEMDLTNLEEIVRFIEHETKLVAVNMKFDSSKKLLQSAIYCLDEEMETWCFLNINDRPQENIQINSTVMLKNWRLDDASIIVNITLGKFLDFGKDNTEMLNLLKCSFCSHSALPPIYQCSKTQSPVCSDCKNQHSTSCNCWQEFGKESRNISLDNIARMLTYPCKNTSCSSYGKAEDMIQHRTICKFSENLCPLHRYVACDWKGRDRQMAPHIDHSHHDLVIGNSETISIDTGSERCIKLIKFSSRWFLFVTVNDARGRFWHVELMGRSENKFRFFIELFNEENIGRYVLGNVCSPLDLSKNKVNQYCYLNNEQLKPLLVGPGKSLKLSVRIL